MAPTHTRALVLTALLLLAAPGFESPTVDAAPAAQGATRRVQTGDRLEAFALPDVDGRDVRHDPDRGRATVLVFLAAHQKRSERAITELSEIVAQLRADGHDVGLLAVVSGGEGPDWFRRMRAELTPALEMPVDADDMLWGRLGVVVTPTTFIVDAEATIRWIRAGHAYDFAREAQTALRSAVGVDALPATPAPGAAPGFDPDTETDADRAYRHLRVGQILARRGREAEAIDELRRAAEIAPDSAPVALALADLLCRAGQPREALAVLAPLNTAASAERAEAAVGAARAHRLLGEMGRASALVDEALALEPMLGRAHYERGRVLESRGDCEAAMAAYRRALEIGLDGGRDR